LGIGDWELGMGVWGLGPIPNPQSPIPNPQSPIETPPKNFENYYIFKFKLKNIIFILIYCITIFIYYY